MVKQLSTNVEAGEKSLGDEHLREATIGIRTFKVGPTDEKSLKQLENNAQAAKNLAESLKNGLGDNAPKVVLITNGDIAQEGLEVLREGELEIIPVDPASAQRRAHLGKLLIGEDSASSGSFSYTDMLDALSDKESHGGEHYVFVSGDLAKRPEELATQLIAMERVRTAFETAVPGQICMVGSMAGGIHDPETITKVVEGIEAVTLANASLVFPNNAISMVEGGTHFSGIADNALTGKVEVDGKQVSVGGNEDFEFAFREMVYRGRVAVLVVHPSMTRLAGEEWKGVDEKYIRRQTVYKLYAERILGQAKAREVIPEGVTFEDVVDNHLFFAQLNNDGKPEIVLTDRQREKGIASPLEGEYMGHDNENIFDLEAYLSQLSEEEERQVRGFVQNVLKATGRTDKEAYKQWSKLHMLVVGGMDVERFYFTLPEKLRGGACVLAIKETPIIELIQNDDGPAHFRLGYGMDTFQNIPPEIFLQAKDLEDDGQYSQFFTKHSEKGLTEAAMLKNLSAESKTIIIFQTDQPGHKSTRIYLPEGRVQELITTPFVPGRGSQTKIVDVKIEEEKQ